jgi:hypothetical protein
VLEIGVTAGIAAVAVVLAWAVAHWSGPIGSRRHRAVLLVASVAIFTLGNAALMPRARAWKQERAVAALLTEDPLFAALLEDDPSLRAPLRAALLQAAREGHAGEAVLVGERLLSPQLWRYVPRASDAAAVDLGRSLVAALTRLQSRDPQQCYRFLFPAVAGPPTAVASPYEDAILSALRRVVASARDGRAEPLDRAAARRRLDAAFGHLRDEHRADVDVLRHARDPAVDRARVCAMTIALYSELLALPPAAAGQALRHVLGPEEPPSARPAPADRPAPSG